MKSKTNWIILGERNTSYFHISALNRRSRNRITCIQNSEGVWCHNLEEVKEIFLQDLRSCIRLSKSFVLLPINGLLIGVLSLAKMKLEA